MQTRHVYRRIAFGRRTCVAALMLPVVVAGACGVPISPLTVKDGSQPYPCQDCPCPCADAASCWRRCCCMTDQQKLAWAQRRGVTPPAFFLEQLAAKTRAGKPGRPATPACCALCVKQPERIPVPAPETRACVVLLSAQLRCQGAGAYLAVLPAALPCPPCVPWMPDDSLVCRVESPDIGGDDVRFEPPEPPPRHVF